MDVHFPKEDAEKKTSFNACSKGNRKGPLSIVVNKLVQYKRSISLDS